MTVCCFTVNDVCSLTLQGVSIYTQTTTFHTRTAIRVSLGTTRESCVSGLLAVFEFSLIHNTSRSKGKK